MIPDYDVTLSPNLDHPGLIAPFLGIWATYAKIQGQIYEL